MCRVGSWFSHGLLARGEMGLTLSSAIGESSISLCLRDMEMNTK